MMRDMKLKVARAARWLTLALAVAGYCLLLWRGPWLLDGAHIRDTNLQPADGVVITGVRTMLVALGAGAIAGIGLYYTSRNHRLAQQQFKHTQEQFQLAQNQFQLAQAQFTHAQEQAAHDREKDRKADELAREAQVTGRYVEAIKLLASASLTERLGGIYSLQRIGLDSPRDRDTVIMVLSNFEREHIRERTEAVVNGHGMDVAQAGGSPPATSWDDIETAQHVVDQLKGRPNGFEPD